jgi:hypothetical protein
VAALLMVVSSLLVTWSSVRVGGAVDLCACPDRRLRLSGWPAKPQAAIHGIAIVLQSICALFLLNLSVEPAIALIAVFAIFAISSVYLWSRWSAIPRWLDMAYGMLTLGNLGMLLGWWTDNRFAPLRNASCCDEFKPWMWIGMLVFANLAMLFLMRRPHPEVRWCKPAMFTGGNLGMIAGMFFGGWVATHIETHSIPFGALVSYLGMSVGMIGGMLLGTEAVRRLIGSMVWIGSFTAESAETTEMKLQVDL